MAEESAVKHISDGDRLVGSLKIVATVSDRRATAACDLPAVSPVAVADANAADSVGYLDSETVAPVVTDDASENRRASRAELAEHRLATPRETQPLRIAWGHAISITAVHLLALLAFFPWFFSWTGVALAIGGFFVYGLLGINLCYHRLLTHQGFTCPKWLEHSLAVLGVCCLQDSPARWVAIHRMHHKHTERQPDPHSPLVNFFWGHVGWLFVEHREHSKYLFYENYARDILRDRFYVRFERRLFWLWTYIGHAALYYVVGLLVGRLWTGSWFGGVQFGASITVWGVFVRTVVEWHNTWAVNSVTHIWGYRNYATEDNSRNHWLVALFAHGEGWHNNHHADQRSAQHGHKWWEYDLTYRVICLLERLGLASNVVRPGVAAARRERPES